MSKQQKPLLGFSYALTTAIFWGSVPIAIKEAIKDINAITLIFYRFVTAAIIIFIILKLKKQKFNKFIFSRRFFILLLLGALGLSMNFVFFTLSVRYIEPSIAQILSQISPYLMMGLSVYILKEKFYFYQKIGAIIMFSGLLLFFNEQIAAIFTGNDAIKLNTLGLILAIAAPFVWVTYGICQKLLLRYFSGQQILFVYYMICAVIFLPATNLSDISNLSLVSSIMFVYCCINTVVGYGAYAEALDNWDVGKVSAVVALTPIFTIMFSLLAHYLMPNLFDNMHLNLLGYIGALVVVTGVAFTAMGYIIVPSWKK